ncbi:SRPBCC family protein [Sphingomonas donggukensis]|uniref:SRPBCC family protein n=1 Tax=Sphingomonas donggukensis TaxID=2949093 RepID=A0ABY4TTU5_9SPHN|nr:SRPBCC family protein [Sphingomonas donggukensis]URW75136.1 SRPBCC family protein [Sphingomonas donggukensis]
MSGPFELSLTRLIDAPVDAVWRAWTEHQDEWFCPRPWRSRTIVQELRAGGRSEIVMHGPDGEEKHLEGVFLEVEPGARVVSTDAFTAGWLPAGPFMVRIDTFERVGENAGGQTRYTATARHWTQEARDNHAAMGFDAGWNAATDQLAAVAERIAAEAR